MDPDPVKMQKNIVIAKKIYFYHSSVEAIYILIILFFFINNSVFTQEVSNKSFYFEFHWASQSSFGPEGSQAEIVGGFDTLSFDKKKHLIPGFKTSSVAEITAGFHKNILQFQSTLSYYKQDVGLIYFLSKNEYPFILLDLLSLKASVLFQTGNALKNGPFGFSTGFSLSSVFPVSYHFNNQTKLNYGIKNFKTAVQLNWGVDFNYGLRIGKKGYYAVAGACITMPGIIGSLGKIETLPNSSFSITRDNIKMYSIKGFLGLGFSLQKE